MSERDGIFCIFMAGHADTAGDRPEFQVSPFSAFRACVCRSSFCRAGERTIRAKVD